LLSRPAGFSAMPQLQQVMRGAYQRPLATSGFKSSPHKLVNTASIFNLAKHRFDRLASKFVKCVAKVFYKNA